LTFGGLRFLHTSGSSTSKRLLPSQFGLPRPCCRPKLHPALTHSHNVSPETKAVAAFQTQRYYTFFTQKGHSFITHFVTLLPSPQALRRILLLRGKDLSNIMALCDQVQDQPCTINVDLVILSSSCVVRLLKHFLAFCMFCR
jgi:hypothetical protein